MKHDGDLLLIITSTGEIFTYATLDTLNLARESSQFKHFTKCQVDICMYLRYVNVILRVFMIKSHHKHEHNVKQLEGCMFLNQRKISFCFKTIFSIGLASVAPF